MATKFANTIIFLFCVYFASILLFVSLHFGEFTASPKTGLIYLGIPVCGLLASLGCFKLSAPLKINLSLLATSTITSIYLAEFFFFYRYYNSYYHLVPNVVKTAAKAGIAYDKRTTVEKALHLREAQGIEAYPYVAPTNFDTASKSNQGVLGVELFPLGGISQKTTVLCNESGEHVIEKSDIHGLRNPNEMWEVETLEIGVVGDSFVHGECVKEGRDIPSLLRERYKKTLNVGYRGNGPLIALATLKEFLPPMRPQRVLWFYFEGNDLDDLRAEKENPILMKYLGKDYSQGLRHRQQEVDALLKDYVEKAFQKAREEQEQSPSFIRFFLSKSLEKTNIKDIVKLTRLRIALSLSRGVEKETIDLLERILKDAQKTVRSWGGKIYFIYLPQIQRYSTSLYPTASRNDVLRTVRGLDIPLIDIHPLFSSHEDPKSLFPYRTQMHYTEEGYRMVAERVLKELEKP